MPTGGPWRLLAALAAAAAPAASRNVRFYGSLQSPAEHPLYAKRAVAPPEYSAFGSSGVGWLALRGFTRDGAGNLSGIDELLARYTDGPDAVSSVVWPNWKTLGAPNFVELVDALRARELGIMMGGFVPGGKGEYNAPGVAPYEAHLGAAMSLGERYLGMGDAEQDIRYLWGYVRNDVWGGSPVSAAGRYEAYAAFRRYSDGVERLSGDKLFALSRGMWAHHYLSTGMYTIAGAELSGGPPGQLTYAFIRGAAKQYGTLTVGNVCSFTRWGHRVPGDPSPTAQCTTGSDHGDTCGTSYSAMKRMMYTLLMYDVALFGFETWFYYPPFEANTTLSPVGVMQARAKNWADATPPARRGVHAATAAFLLDVFAGWEVPCSDPGKPFTGTFGQAPYGAADFLADGLFDLAYPGYRNTNYFKDGRYELSPTPYGDVFDAVLSDASSGLLARYDTVFVAHALQTQPITTGARLAAFVQGGGQLVVPLDALLDLARGGAAAVEGFDPVPSGACTAHAAGVTVSFRSGGAVTEPAPVVLCALAVPANATVLATTADGAPVAFRTAANAAGGSMTVLGYGNYGVATAAQPVPPACQEDAQTLSPQPVAAAVLRLAADAMKDQALFDLGTAGDGPATNLSWVPKRVSDTEYVLGVSNTRLAMQPLRVRATSGVVASVTEVQLDQSEKNATGYLPHGFLSADIGVSTNTTIAGVDFRMLRVTFAQPPRAAALPHSVLPRSRANVWLRLPPGAPVIDSVQRRPNFAQTFDGLLLDASYFHARDPAALRGDARWLAARGMRFAADLSRLIDVFPGLRLGAFTPPSPEQGVAAGHTFFNESIAYIHDVIRKCSASTVCGDAVLTLHAQPENGPSPADVAAAVAATVAGLVRFGAGLAPPVAVHLRHSTKNAAFAGPTAATQVGWARGAGARFAPNTGLAAREGADVASLIAGGCLLLVDGSNPRGWGSEVLPVVGNAQQPAVERAVRAARDANVTVVLDAAFSSEAEEERDTLWLAQALQA